MKTRIFVIALLVFACQFATAQVNYGIKGGLNFNASELSVGSENLDSDDSSGYHAGVWMRFKVPVVGIYVRPEVIYTSLSTEYSLPMDLGKTAKFNLNRIDVPVLLGMKFIGVGNFFIGPSFQYVLDSDFSVAGIDLEKDDAKEDINVGFQIGLGIEFWKLGIDVRYESAFSKAESAYNDSAEEALINNFKIDNQPNQFVLGLSYKF
ncbi:PorT family protein [Flavicella sp.]|nr:porin family protein [Flavicella sp.]MDA9111413.1 PorT family protein [Flavicella sp.]